MSTTQKADRSDRVSELEAERDAALARAERAEKALEFYSDLKNFEFRGWQGDMDPPLVFIDRGELARAVLTRPEAEEGESRHGAS